MFFPFIFALFVLGVALLSPNTPLILNNSVDLTKPRVEVNGRIIIIGTKWCGYGNKSENLYDLGAFVDIDLCCRNHDFCPDIMEGYSEKYNLRNPSSYTRLSCDCDQEFRKCLQAVNTLLSKTIEFMYFSFWWTQCYKKDFPIKACVQHAYFPRRKCKEYELDETQEKIYQWFDV